MATLDMSQSLPRPLSPEPFAVITLRWLREQRQAIRDFIILTTLSIFTFILLFEIDFTELFFEFTRKHEGYNLDELLVSSLLVIAIYLPVFALRRWGESTKRLHQANTDSLTGLFNRRKGWEALEVEIARAQRHHHPLSIILFDVDRFKEINDKHGHLVGDRTLRSIARTVQEDMRSFDLLIRWGGEEFMIITPETDRDGAAQVAERMRHVIEQVFESGPVQVTASFGVAQLQEKDDLNALYRRVDERLYAAKTSGRNRVA